MRLMRACGKGECRILPTSIPGTLRSSVYLPAPVVLPAASTMAMGLPMMEKSVIAHNSGGHQQPGLSSRAKSRDLLLSCFRHSLLLGLNRGLDRVIHLAITGAAAQIPAERAADIFLGRPRILRQQMRYRHDETGSAESALRAAPVAISLLDRRQAAVLANTFNSRDLLTFATGSKHGAREHGHAIQLHGASSAGGIITTAL